MLSRRGVSLEMRLPAKLHLGPLYDPKMERIKS